MKEKIIERINLPACCDCKHARCARVSRSCYHPDFERKIKDIIGGSIVTINPTCIKARDDETKCGLKGDMFEQRVFPSSKIMILLNEFFKN